LSIIADFPEQITGVSATPAAGHLFKMREDGKKLSEEQADAFHQTVYQLLFAANRAHRDLQTVVSFLTTRVQAPVEDDWGKLKKVLKYLNETRYLKLILGADAMNFAIHWYIDGSHQIHEDCRGTKAWSLSELRQYRVLQTNRKAIQKSQLRPR